MSDWKVTVETPEGTATGRGDDVLDAFLSAFQANPTVSGPAAGADPDRDILSATFSVDAPTRDEAAFVACLAYWRALGDAGLEVRADSRLQVELREEPDGETQRVDARIALDAAE